MNICVFVLVFVFAFDGIFSFAFMCLCPCLCVIVERIIRKTTGRLTPSKLCLGLLVCFHLLLCVCVCVSRSLNEGYG